MRGIGNSRNCISSRIFSIFLILIFLICGVYIMNVQQHINSSAPLPLPRQSPPYCSGAVAWPSDSSSLLASPNATEKYLVFYPRAGMGNVLMGYTSAATYACLTGRTLKIAPPDERETSVFECEKYFDSGPQRSGSISICDDLEMDSNLIDRYKRSRAEVRTPEAWTPDMCKGNKKHLQHFLCDDGKSGDEFVAISSCQYYGDLFNFNPNFKDRISANPFREILRERLRPSLAVKEKMVKSNINDGGGPYHACIHIRADGRATQAQLGPDWLNNLKRCTSNLYQGHTGSRDVLLFTMHGDVRDSIKRTLEAGTTGSGNATFNVTFASEVHSAGNHGHSSDPYQGIADMFSLASSCINVLPSFPKSTYALTSFNLMNETRVFPGDQWSEADACTPGREASVNDMRPEGDFWNNVDFCSIRDTTCGSSSGTALPLLPSGNKEESVEPLLDEAKSGVLNLEAVQNQVVIKVPQIAAEGILQNNDSDKQDSKCKRMFEWSMIDAWKITGPTDANVTLPITWKLDAVRLGGPSATGPTGMKIQFLHEKLHLTVVDTRVFGGQSIPMVANLWHRTVSQYGSWVGLQVAQRKFNLVSNHTVYLFDCRKKPLSDLPQEWHMIGDVSCDANLLQKADVVIEPPAAGMLWDLAWDFDFECHNSQMFKSFTSLFVDPSIRYIPPPEPMGCFISRQGRGLREVRNINDTMKMMETVFPRVQLIQFAQSHTTNETVAQVRECRVILGVHGAGQTNAMFARPGVAFIEMIGKNGNDPAYYRNLNMMLGHYYEAITGDPSANIGKSEFWNIDLEEARSALEKARDYVELWIKDHGYWR